MLICIDKVMDDIEALIRDKAIARNFIKDLNDKRNSIDDKLQDHKIELQAIDKRLETRLQIAEVMKLREDEIIDEAEAEISIEQLQKELEAFIIRNECEGK